MSVASGVVKLLALKQPLNVATMQWKVGLNTYTAPALAPVSGAPAATTPPPAAADHPNRLLPPALITVDETCAHGV